jgi:hypothetical protein
MDVLPAAKHKTVVVVQVLEYGLCLLEKPPRMVQSCFVYRLALMLYPQQACADDQGRGEH